MIYYYVVLIWIWIVTIRNNSLPFYFRPKDSFFSKIKSLGVFNKGYTMAESNVNNTHGDIQRWANSAKMQWKTIPGRAARCLQGRLQKSPTFLFVRCKVACDRSRYWKYGRSFVPRFRLFVLYPVDVNKSSPNQEKT